MLIVGILGIQISYAAAGQDLVVYAQEYRAVSDIFWSAETSIGRLSLACSADFSKCNDSLAKIDPEIQRIERAAKRAANAHAPDPALRLSWIASLDCRLESVRFDRERMEASRRFHNGIESSRRATARATQRNLRVESERQKADADLGEARGRLDTTVESGPSWDAIQNRLKEMGERCIARAREHDQMLRAFVDKCGKECADILRIKFGS